MNSDAGKILCPRCGAEIAQPQGRFGKILKISMQLLKGRIGTKLQCQKCNHTYNLGNAASDADDDAPLLPPPDSGKDDDPPHAASCANPFRDYNSVQSKTRASFQFGLLSAINF